MAEHLNAQQQAQLQAAITTGVVQAIERLQLRKWSMEQALETISESALSDNANLTALAQTIFDFVAGQTPVIPASPGRDPE